MIKIYSDGGCSGNPGPGGWAYLIIRDEEGGVRSEEILAEKWGAEESTTNNRMELRAVIESLNALKSMDIQPKKAALYTDSQYVQKGMTEWMRDWKKRGWKTSDKKPVKNQDLWLCLDALAAELDIEWIWVKGHAGNKYNEHCDFLTQKAIASINSKN